MSYRFLLLYLLIAPLASFAQYSDSVHHYAGLTSNGTVNKTATSDAYVLNNAVKLGIRQKDVSANVYASWLYGKQQNKLTNDDVVATLNMNLYKTFPRFYYWVLGNYTSAYSLKITNQYQGGGGIAYSFIDKKDAYLNVSDGIIYEYSDIIRADTVDKYSTFRNSLRLSFRFVIRDIITVSSMSFYQPSFQSSDDYIIKSNASLGVKILKWMSLSTTYTYNRFNRTGRENTMFTYGLSVEKFF